MLSKKKKKKDLYQTGIYRLNEGHESIPFLKHHLLSGYEEEVFA